MPRQKAAIPKYSHGPAGTARIRYTHEGRRITVSLGKYGTAESKAAYAREVAEITRQQSTTPLTHDPIKPGSNLLVMDLCTLWITRNIPLCSRSEANHWQRALGVLQLLDVGGIRIGEMPAAEFGPLMLRNVRDHMVSIGWSRPHINAQVNRIKRLFAWASEHELIPVEKVWGLKLVATLKRGKTTAGEYEEVLPVDDKTIRATIKHLSPTVADMVRFQRATGCRPAEVCRLRIEHVTRTSAVLWHFSPPDHKNAHRGHIRTIPMGRKAIAIVRKYAGKSGPVFSPRVAIAELDTAKRKAAKVRRRKILTGPSIFVGVEYSVDSYRRAIARACDEAGVTRWSPNQLRHTRLSEVREKYGLEAAQRMGDHKHASTTERYAKVQANAADKAAMGDG